MAESPVAVGTPGQVGIAEPQPARTRVTGFENPMSGALEQASRQAAGVAQDFQARQDKQNQLDYATATNAFLTQKVNLDEQYQKDPDFATAPDRYKVDLQKQADQIAGTITDPAIRANFNARVVQPSQLQGWSTLYKVGQAREADNGVAWLNQTTIDNGNNLLRATDDATRGMAVTATMQAIDAAQTQGWITATAAQERRSKVQSDYAIARLDNYSPSDQLKLLTAGTHYPGQPLPADTQGAIDSSAKQAGGSSSETATFAKIESAGDPTAPNGGLFQVQGALRNRYIAKYGHEPEQGSAAEQATFFHDTLPEVKSAFAKLTGRQPTEQEGYLAWQQGASGAKALLDNPGQSAIATLTPLYAAQKGATLGAQTARNAILGNVDPDTKRTNDVANWTGQQFVDYWKQRYDATNSGGTAAPVQVVSLGASDAGTIPAQGAADQPASDVGQPIAYTKTGTFVDAIPLDQRQALINKANAGIRAQTVQEAAEVKAQQTQAKMAIEQVEIDTKQQMLAHSQDPAHSPAVDILDVMKNPAFAGNPDEARAAFDRMVNFQAAANRGGAASAVALKAEQEDLPKVLSGEWTQKDIDAQFSAGAYDKPVLDFLTAQAKRGAGDPGKRVNQNMSAMLAMVLPQIEAHPDKDHPELPIQREAAFRFKQDLAAAVDQKMKAGEDPNVLFTPGNKEYFGRLENLTKYSKSWTQWQAEQTRALFQEAIGPSATNAAPAASAAQAPQLPPDLPQGAAYGGLDVNGNPYYLYNGQKIRKAAGPTAPLAP